MWASSYTEQALKWMIQRDHEDSEEVPSQWECKLICETDEQFHVILDELIFDDRAIELYSYVEPTDFTF